MNNISFKSFRWVGTGFVLMVAAFGLLYLLAGIESAAKRGQPLPVLAEVPSFTLTNHAGRTVTLADFRGQVWVADIIFTHCSGPCPKMTGRMKRLQDALPATSRVCLVTLTTDPDSDSPEVMRAYGEQFGADFARWILLTGAKPELVKLAIDGLKLGEPVTPEERAHPDELFIHSTRFAVVDKQGRLRATFDTAGQDLIFEQIKPKLLATVAQLEREP